jgi:hypothetical protein
MTTGRDKPHAGKRNRGAWLKAYLARPEVKAHRPAYAAAYHAEHKERLNARRKERASAPEAKARRCTPEARARARAHAALPEVKARKKVYEAKPEVRARARAKAAARRKAKSEGRQKLLAYMREYQSQRRQAAAVRLRESVSAQIYNALRKRKAGQSWEKLAGYTLEDLIQHLERQFKRGMTWENYGKAWQIDHIVPVSAFTFAGADDPAFKACWALSNLRPLARAANIRKGGKRVHLL